jgi:PIN domain nuclease of toxin-antitoxin system
VDLEVGSERTDLRITATTVILLDTNALIWVDRGHPRGAALTKRGARLYVSPANLLELQFLIEAGRLRMRGEATIADLAADDRWVLDDPPSAAWFEKAMAIGWTRDPFDRLLVAHARLRNWRLATSDATVMEHLTAAEYLEV